MTPMSLYLALYLGMDPDKKEVMAEKYFLYLNVAATYGSSFAWMRLDARSLKSCADTWLSLL